MKHHGVLQKPQLLLQVDLLVSCGSEDLFCHYKAPNYFSESGGGWKAASLVFLTKELFKVKITH